jgi:hypothetical protein
MGDSRQSPLDLNSLLAAVEAAPPVAAADVLAGALAESIDAREVSFLIADFSGQSLIRLGHAAGKVRSLPLRCCSLQPASSPGGPNGHGSRRRRFLGRLSTVAIAPARTGPTKAQP